VEGAEDAGEAPVGRRGVLRIGNWAVKILAAALAVFLVVYIGYLWQTVRGLNDNVQRLHVLVGGQSIDKRTGKTVTRHDIDGTDQNILLIGNDDRSTLTDAQVRELKVGRDGGSLSTDTLMIVHVPADGSRATLISLPRDSYVRIPGHGMNKINAAYPDGYVNAKGNRKAKAAAGVNLLMQTVENLTGLNIDHFVAVSLLGFVSISDAIHGVQIDLCHSVDDTVAHNEALGLGQVGSGLKLSKGEHTIKGVQALEFVRQRHNIPNVPIGDIGRTARQRYFLTAAFRKIASAGILLNIGKLRALVQAVDKSIFVDQNLNMLDLARQMSNLSANNIRGEVIPTDHYADVTIDGILSNVGIIIPSQVRAFVHRIIHGSSAHKHHRHHAKKHKAIDAGCIN
jgi:LCP family protein required for cell wall assembly